MTAGGEVVHPQGNRKRLEMAWDALARGDPDELATFYADDMIFVIPGQGDVLHGRTAFRGALDNLDSALPPGFGITGLRYCEGDGEIVNGVQWRCDALPGGAQSAVLFRFDGHGLVHEERRHIDTEQWKGAFP